MKPALCDPPSFYFFFGGGPGPEKEDPLRNLTYFMRCDGPSIVSCPYANGRPDGGRGANGKATPIEVRS